MSAYEGIDLRAMVTAEFLALAELLDDMEDASWNTLSLCAGWRVREVVAHLTMPVRYSPARFQAELQDCRGDFTQLSNRIASRDAMLPTGVLVGAMRDEAMHRWTPPGGGDIGALTHVVIHGLDVTVPLGRGHRPDEALRTVLADLTTGAPTSTSASGSTACTSGRLTWTGASARAARSAARPNTSPSFSAGAPCRPGGSKASSGGRPCSQQSDRAQARRTWAVLTARAYLTPTRQFAATSYAAPGDLDVPGPGRCRASMAEDRGDCPGAA